MKLGKKVLYSIAIAMFACAVIVQEGVGLSLASSSAGQEHDKHADIPRITVDELILMLAKKRPVTIIDVRNSDSYQEKIVGALEIPHDEIKSRLKEIPRNREIVTYCA